MRSTNAEFPDARTLPASENGGTVAPGCDDRAVRLWAVFSYLVAYAHDESPPGIVSIVHGARDLAEIQRHLRTARDEVQ